ncbi:hypothetical protein GM3709_841 [Geminocystis sp. NIES-3709]|nr:hypothetical protein GM3709_841 [Geminocystis sp. NIES-3709]
MDSSPDVDNIIKPIIDAISGKNGIIAFIRMMRYSNSNG